MVGCSLHEHRLADGGRYQADDGDRLGFQALVGLAAPFALAVVLLLLAFALVVLLQGVTHDEVLDDADIRLARRLRPHHNHLQQQGRGAAVVIVAEPHPGEQGAQRRHGGQEILENQALRGIAHDFAQRTGQFGGPEGKAGTCLLVQGGEAVLGFHAGMSFFSCSTMWWKIRQLSGEER